MSSEKSKRARQAAESLFGGGSTGKAMSSSGRKANPFDDDPFKPVGQPSQGRDDLVVFPTQMEIPRGYDDAAHMRDVLARAWRMDWVKIGKDECVVRLPVGWRADRSVDGVLRIYSDKVVRAEGRFGANATLQILPRYYLKAEFHDSDERCRIVVRDRDRGNSTLKESFWDTRSGPNHPQWKILSDWLDAQYPDHRDPLKYWQDCEDNSEA